MARATVQKISPKALQNCSRARIHHDRWRQVDNSRRRALPISMSRSVSSPGCELAVRDGEVQLVVQLQRPVVEVGRPDHAPDAIGHERLRMHHRRLVLVDLDAGPTSGGRRNGGEACLTGIASVTSPSASNRTRTPRCTASVSAHNVDSSGYEGPGGDVERAASPRRSPANRPLEIVAATARRAAHHEGRAIAPAPAIGSSSSGVTIPARLDVVLVILRLPSAGQADRAPRFGCRAIPTGCRASPLPLVVHSGAAGERDLAVDDQDLAMRPVVEFLEGVPPRGVEQRHRASGRPQPGEGPPPRPCSTRRRRAGAAP